MIRDVARREVVMYKIIGWMGQDQDRRRALEAGFDHHLSKPIDPDRLEDLIRSRNADGQRTSWPPRRPTSPGLADTS